MESKKDVRGCEADDALLIGLRGEESLLVPLVELSSVGKEGGKPIALFVSGEFFIMINFRINLPSISHPLFIHVSHARRLALLRNKLLQPRRVHCLILISNTNEMERKLCDDESELRLAAERLRLADACSFSLAFSFSKSSERLWASKSLILICIDGISCSFMFDMLLEYLNDSPSRLHEMNEEILTSENKIFDKVVLGEIFNKRVHQTRFLLFSFEALEDADELTSE